MGVVWFRLVWWYLVGQIQHSWFYLHSYFMLAKMHSRWVISLPGSPSLWLTLCDWVMQAGCWNWDSFLSILHLWSIQLCLSLHCCFSLSFCFCDCCRSLPSGSYFHLLARPQGHSWPLCLLISLTWWPVVEYLISCFRGWSIRNVAVPAFLILLAGYCT